jgi:hypothetical protein
VEALIDILNRDTEENRENPNLYVLSKEFRAIFL